MANKTFSCLLILILALSNQVLCTQGRNLSETKILECSTHCSDPVPKIVTLQEAKKNVIGEVLTGRPQFRFIEGEVDSFRPTNPGRSPGIGHSKHN